MAPPSGELADLYWQPHHLIYQCDGNHLCVHLMEMMSTEKEQGKIITEKMQTEDITRGAERWQLE